MDQDGTDCCLSIMQEKKPSYYTHKAHTHTLNILWKGFPFENVSDNTLPFVL